MPGATPIYAFPYPDPSDLVANYPALGQDLAEDVETVISGLGGGLDLISPTTIANSGGTATSTDGTTTFTTVNSVSLNGVFSATYAHYRIMLDYVASTSGTTNMRMRTAGTDNSNANYGVRGADVGALTAATSAGATFFEIGSNGTSGNLFVSDLMNPQAAFFTQGTWCHYRETVAVVATWRGGAFGFGGSTSFDGLTIYPASGTITGKIRVYGWKGA